MSFHLLEKVTFATVFFSPLCLSQSSASVFFLFARRLRPHLDRARLQKAKPPREIEINTAHKANVLINSLKMCNHIEASYLFHLILLNERTASFLFYSISRASELHE